MRCFSVVFFTATGLFTLAQVLILVKSTALSVTDGDFSENNQTKEGISTTLSPQEGTTVNYPEHMEKLIKGFLKDGVKMVVSRVMDNFDRRPKLSPKCLKAFMRLLSDLTKARMWALKMLDASSKVPAGVLEGTLTDYGDFDECLEISVPLRNGSEDFRGRFCAIEVIPPMPPIPKNYSLSNLKRAKPLDTLATELRLTQSSFHFIELRMGVCIPSSCSAEDLRNIVPSVVNISQVDVRIPKCYVKESLKFYGIHIAVLCVSASLVILAICGTAADYFKTGRKGTDSGPLAVLSSFSLTRNSQKLFAASKGDLAALHGIRFLSMAWVILGHTYVYVSYDRVRRLSNMRIWVNSFEFEAVLNGWLAVEGFFFLSGFLTCYGTLQVLEKTKGRLNFPMFVIHRYLRLTPSMLLSMGLVFFLPLMASGPFWYDIVDVHTGACWNNWWTNVLYIANWWPVDQTCIIPLWYLAADFQLFILSFLLTLLLYRSVLFGIIALVLLTVVCNLIVGVLTYVLELHPTILISTGNVEQIDRILKVIHRSTFTHAGPYIIGLATGYIILKNKNNLQFKKWQRVLGWSFSITLSVCSVYGVHIWNTGYFHGPFVTSLYAAMHRTTFILGVAWVAIACITGIGGPVNFILSRKIWIPLGRLTYVMYLLHAPIIWIRSGSLRERLYLNHYNMMYEYFSNLVFAISMSVPFYLLVEAPSNNLHSMMFRRSRSTKRSGEKKETDTNGIVTSNSALDKSSVEVVSSSGNFKNGIPSNVTEGFSVK